MAASSARERIRAALRGEVIDRAPFSLWRHFYEVEGAGARPLAERLVAFVLRHDLDLLKYNPRAHYHAEPWGTRYRYSGRDEKPTLVGYAVASHRDWRGIERRHAGERVFLEMLEGLRIAHTQLPELPLVMTVFTPLAVLERIGGRERVLADLREHPADLLIALEAVTETFAEFARACLDAGADGIFLATTEWARRDVLSDDEYARFGRPYDLRVLEAVAGAPFNVLHACGPTARVLELADYPVAAVSWNTNAAGTPSLGAFLDARADRVAIGGLSDEALVSRQPAPARREILRGLEESRGTRWIAAGGCTIPTASDPLTIDGAREALERVRTR